MNRRSFVQFASLVVAGIATGLANSRLAFGANDPRIHSVAKARRTTASSDYQYPKPTHCKIGEDAPFELDRGASPVYRSHKT